VGMMRGIASGMRYLSEMGYVHRVSGSRLTISMFLIPPPTPTTYRFALSCPSGGLLPKVCFARNLK